MILVIILILALIFLPWPWALVAIVIGALLELCLWFFGARYSRRRRARVGVQTMIGATGEAITALAPGGQVKVDGTIWEARATGGLRAGDPIVVRSIDGLTLEVEKAGAGSP
ncbi:MAG TPA: NfeD family protein [Gaiellaceae bacterium]|jgi:membrane-bound serine protease (ClpP class)|nr:NfeD family protein [Gaiellaceae bacterium]